MVAGFHLIWTLYGWWLANDPRGSWSTELRVEELAELGDLHFGRKAVQPSSSEIREHHGKARDLLKHPLLTLTDEDNLVVAAAFSEIISERKYTCHACAIMPDHIHILIRKHRDHAEEMLEHLQEKSRTKLIEAGRRSATHPVWGGPDIKCFFTRSRIFNEPSNMSARIPSRSANQSRNGTS